MAELPFVSVITPTYNRRRFLGTAIACYEAQTYPKDRMEWVIIDDGVDSVADVFAEAAKRIPNIRYIRHETRALIGAKRNELHREAKGEIMVSWDDDDYYPPDRVSHVVDVFAQNPDISVAGCSTIYVYFSDRQEIYRLGPFSRRHATNGTMAVRRQFATTHFYDETVSHGEEESFLDNFIHPLIQLSPLRVMLVMSHDSNTFEKGQLRDNPRAASSRTDLTLAHFIRDEKLREAFQAVASEVQKENTMRGLPELAAAARAKKLAEQKVVPAVAPPDPVARASRLRALRMCSAPTVQVGRSAQSYAIGVVAAVRAQLPGAVDWAGAGRPDILIAHITEFDGMVPHSETFTVVISGEAWQQRIRADVVIAPTAISNAHAHVFYPFSHSSLAERRVPFPTAPAPYGERRRYCAFMYSAPVAHRNKLFEDLTAMGIEGGLCAGQLGKFEALGAQCNPNPVNLTRNVYSDKETYNDIAVATYGEFKYVLAVENAWVENYFTEKIINPIAAGAVPLYWGHPSVFEYINKARVIYIPDYADTYALAKALAATTPEAWAAIVAAPWYTAKGEPAAVEAALASSLRAALTAAPAVPATPAADPALRDVLQWLPPVYYINLDRRPDRRAHFEAIAAAAGLKDATRTVAVDGIKARALIKGAPPAALSVNELACLISHLRAIREWLETSDSEFAFICEDDVSFETAAHWGCNWSAILGILKEEKMPSGADWDVIQAALTYVPELPAIMNLHPRLGQDWCAAAYLLRRSYAEKLIDTHWDVTTRRWTIPEGAGKPTSENLILHGNCLSIPLFTYINTGSDIQSKEHTAVWHNSSRERVLAAWKSGSATKLVQQKTTVLG
jgi:hypothetical protein